ncbi:unnamed protein product [Pleuronectes platessa]|uniref:Uncharacterized protein n=1 Tax=Pleuronectes platessa TaxID=8262 RepID=A0A9N7UXH5_PLEPL|nr:unnamed protein product [Pleuronectes platessa]
MGVAVCQGTILLNLAVSMKAFFITSKHREPIRLLEPTAADAACEPGWLKTSGPRIAHWEIQTEFLWQRCLAGNLLTLALRPGASDEEEEEEEEVEKKGQ